MKKFLLLLLTLALWSFSLQVEAKNGKVKYGKYSYYEGETENGQGHGNCVSPRERRSLSR